MDLCSELKKEIGLFSALRLKCVSVYFQTRDDQKNEDVDNFRKVYIEILP